MPTSMTLGQIVQPVQDGQALPLQHGVQLAQAEQEMQQKQVQTQAMQNQLDQQKWTSFKGRMGTYLSAAPAIQKALKPQMQQWMQQQGFDPGIVDAAGDQDYGQQIRQALDFTSRNPIDASKAVQSLASLDTFDSGVGALVGKRAEALQASDLKEATLANARMIAQGHDEAHIAAASAKNAVTQGRLDFQYHKKAVGDVNDDKMLNDLQTSTQNIGNALANFQASNRNPEEFAQLQQALRTNSGIKGTSTGNERADSYLHDYGISAQDFLQKLSGDPQDIMKTSPKFVDLVQKVAQAELDNKRKQATGRLGQKAAGYQSFYADPDHDHFKSDFNDVVTRRAQQFGIDPSSLGIASLGGQQQQPSAAGGQGTAPQGGAAGGQQPQLSINQQNYVKMIKAAAPDMSDDQILKRMQAKGIK